MHTPTIIDTPLSIVSGTHCTSAGDDFADWGFSCGSTCFFGPSMSSGSGGNQFLPVSRLREVLRGRGNRAAADRRKERRQVVGEDGAGGHGKVNQNKRNYGEELGVPSKGWAKCQLNGKCAKALDQILIGWSTRGYAPQPTNNGSVRGDKTRTVRELGYWGNRRRSAILGTNPGWTAIPPPLPTPSTKLKHHAACVMYSNFPIWYLKRQTAIGGDLSTRGEVHQSITRPELLNDKAHVS